MDFRPPSWNFDSELLPTFESYRGKARTFGQARAPDSIKYFPKRFSRLISRGRVFFLGFSNRNPRFTLHLNPSVYSSETSNFSLLTLPAYAHHATTSLRASPCNFLVDEIASAIRTSQQPWGRQVHMQVTLITLLISMPSFTCYSRGSILLGILPS
jgi:hypothetical protein